MPRKLQASGSRGELSQGLWGRADLAAYATGLKTCRNTIVHPAGGMSNRAGYHFGPVTRLGDQRVALRRFRYTASQSYLLEFGHLYLRVVQNNGHVLEPATAVTGATNANPGVITSVAHGLGVDDWVSFSGVGGMTRLNGRTFLVNSVPTANTLTVKGYTGTAINTTDTALWGAYTAGGSVARVKTVVTPWTESDLARLSVDQIGDVMTVTSAGHPVQEVIRGPLGHYDWTVSPQVVGPRVSAPTDLVIQQDYGIAINQVQLNKTVGGNETRLVVAPRYNVIREGDRIRITGLTTVTELNNRFFLVSRADPSGSTSELFIVNTNGTLIDETGFAAAVGTYSETGRVSTEEKVSYRVTAQKDGEESQASTDGIRRDSLNPQQTAPLLVKWIGPLLAGGSSGEPDPLVKRYFVYKEKNGLYGFLGQREAENKGRVAVSGFTSASPAVVTTAAAHGFSRGDKVYFFGLTAPTNPNGFTHQVGAVLSPTTFEVIYLDNSPVDSTAWAAYVASGNDYVQFSDCWFADDDIAPELEDPAPPQTATAPFSAAGDYPACVCTHEERRIYAGMDNDPRTVQTTRTGNFYNFDERTPRRADDAMRFTLASRYGDGILHVLSMKELFIFLDESVWVSETGDGGGYSLDVIRNREVSNNGAASYPAPLSVQRTALYVHRNRKQVWDLGFEVTGVGYNGYDRALYAEQLFQGKEIIDWCYQHTPDRVVWMVLNDGTLVSLTYVPEEEVYGWAKHDTPGNVESICNVPEGVHDAVYISVERSLESLAGRRSIERMDDRDFSDLRDAFFVDSGLSWDQPVDITAVTLAAPVVVTAAGHSIANGDHVAISDVEGTTELNDEVFRVGYVNGNDLWLVARQFENGADKAISGITNANPAVVTCAAHGRATNDLVYISGVLGMTQVNGTFFNVEVLTADIFRLRTLAIANVDSSAWGVYTLDGRMDVAAAVDGTGFTAYSRGGSLREAISQPGGLDHLVGELVAILADGDVKATQVVAADGTVTLSGVPAGRIHIGLPYRSEVETLDLIDPGGELTGKYRQVDEIVLRLRRTRGLWTGVDEAHLTERWNRLFESYDEPTAFLEGEYVMMAAPDTNRHGRVLIQQRDPLPFTLLGIVTEFEVIR